MIITKDHQVDVLLLITEEIKSNLLFLISSLYLHTHTHTRTSTIFVCIETVTCTL